MKNKRVFIFVLLILLPMTMVQASAKEAVVVPKGFAMFLPKDGSVKTVWVALPLSEEKVRKADFIAPCFHFDAKGALWMGYDHRVMSNFSTGISFSLDKPLNDFIFLDNNALFVVTDEAFGFLGSMARDKISETNPILPFKPISLIPLERARLVSDGKDLIGIYGRDPSSGLYTVLLLDKDFVRWHKVFASEEMINAVRMRDGFLFIANGRNIYRLKPNEKGVNIVFTHPTESILDVDYKAGAGLFYATRGAVGVVGKLSAELIKCPLPQIFIRDNDLYVIMPGNLGVFRLSNIDHLLVEKLKSKDF
jgi:hypothetical protein